MKIGILGSRGIPNRYGGFEECAEMLSLRWQKAGHQVSVYCSKAHPYQQSHYEEVQLHHMPDPENAVGTAGQFIYDFNCLMHAHRQRYDVLLMLGYTSSSLWRRLYPSGPLILNNMDGLEWKRSKYKPSVKRFLRLAEKWAVKGSDILIADAMEIADYLEKHYSRHAVYIPYGAHIPSRPDNKLIADYQVEPGEYHLAIARLEPENNLEIILRGVMKSEDPRPFLLIGNHHTAYGEKLKSVFRDSRIRFIGAQYDKAVLNALRYHCRWYFHGHSVGGTNPSLLEAMACSASICAHNNAFNREVLGADGSWFIDEHDVANLLNLSEPAEVRKQKQANNLQKIRERYNWDVVAGQYLVVMEQGLIQR